jgi:hypothetical protein
MYDEHNTRSTRWQWLTILGMVVALLVTSPVPGHAWRRARVYVRPSIVVPFEPYWGPYYWGPYAYAPVIVTPPPPVYVQPAPQTPTIARIPRVIIRMSSSALVAGNQSRRHHNRHRTYARACSMAAL